MSTYTPIASVTLSSAQSSVTFSGIPQTYTDLILVINAGNASGSEQDCLLRFNSDAGSNYSATYLYGDGASAISGRNTNVTTGSAGYPLRPTLISTLITQIQNYSNTTTYKTWLSRGNGANNVVHTMASLWRSTSAITSIQIYPSNSANFLSGSTFNLYGISSADGITPKASGGNQVYSDGTNWYHIFTSSGTFTPTQALSNVDYLVVAGGGSGSAGEAGGGGGAGGMRCTVTATGGGGTLESKLSFSAQAYTITVGAGGAANGSSGSNSSISGTGFSTITSTGGGGTVFISSGLSGGSGGGGGGGSGATGGAGTANQGYAGGNGYGNAPRIGGGGGGAGAVGANATSTTPGAGGNGVATSITGSSVTYAGGGGGATNSGGGGANGGSGGGGNGGGGGTSGPQAGGINTGGGGGGNGSSENPSATGGSGIVIIRYAV